MSKRARTFARIFCGALWLGLAGLPGAPAQDGGFRPLQEGERLIYRILWPSGVTLGEAVFRVTPSGKQLQFQLTVEANLPQYKLTGALSSVATQDGLCSLQFHQKIGEGPRQSEESLEFDQAAHQARRSRGSQTTTEPIPECARDPLTFLYYYRSQLAAGKTAGSGTVFGKSKYELRIEPAGSETLSVGGKPRPAEKFQVTYTGSSRERKFVLWFATGGARVPLRVTLPSSLAEFSAELQ